MGPDPGESVPSGNAWMTDAEMGKGNRFIDQPWQRMVVDKKVVRLVENALVENADLKILKAKLELAYSGVAVTASAMRPAVSAGSDGQFLRLSNEENPVPELYARDRSPFGGGLSLSWEIDWWGRIRRQTEAVSYEADAAEWDLAAAKTVVVNSVLSLVVQREVLATKLELMKLVAEIEQKRCEIMESRLEAGDVREEMLLSARAGLESAESNILVARREALAINHQLAEWCGLPKLDPDALPVGGNTVLNDRVFVAGGKLGVLLRRPDVAAAEARYRAAVARVGAAQASRWPELQLFGRGGVLSSSVSELLKSQATRYSLGLETSLPIMDGGAGESRVKKANATMALEDANHRKVLLRALHELMLATEDLGLARQILTRTQNKKAHLEQKWRIEGKRIDQGESDKLAGLDAHVDFLMASIDECNAKLNTESAALHLYRAMGGGWR